MFKVYFLICPIENIVRYVGITSFPLDKRLKEHLYDSKRSNPHKYYWIQNLKKQNFKPKIILIQDNLLEEQACSLEVSLISLMRFLLGDKLINIHPGGNKPPILIGDKNPSKRAEVIKKITDKTRGRKIPDLLKYKFIGENHSGVKLTNKKVIEIRELYKSGNFTLIQLGEKFGVGFKCISKIINRLRWKHI